MSVDPERARPRWPRLVDCCMYADCGYVAGPNAVAGIQMCPVHGTPLARLLLEPITPKEAHRER